MKRDADVRWKYGYIDETGKVVVPLEYDDAYDFSDGLARVMKGDWETGKYGFVEKTGKVVVPMEYGYAGFLEMDDFGPADGLCVVEKGEVYGVFENPYYVSPKIFKDASPWAQEDLCDARDAGLTSPTEGLSYNQPITREKFAEVCVKLYEVLSGSKAPDATNNPFTDTENPEILKAYALGIVNGTGPDTFAPNDNVTRESVATMLMCTVNAAGVNLPSGTPTTFSDDGQVSSCAKEAVAVMANAKVIRGIGDSRFDPGGTATVEQSVIMANRILHLNQT